MNQRPEGHVDEEQSTVEICGIYSPWRRCFESSTFSVTSKVTDVMTVKIEEPCKKHRENLIQGWGYVLTLTTQLWPFLFPTVSLPRLKFIVQAKSLEGTEERRIQAVHTVHAEGKKHGTLGNRVGVSACRV